MQRVLTVFCLLLLGATALQAQSYAFGFKGGPTIGLQQWESFNRDPLLAFHGIAFIETAEENEPWALFAQAGYNPKGSAIQTRNAFGINGNIFQVPTQEFIFHNISLSVGAKQRFDLLGKSSNTYYLLGLRVDYNLDTNLDEYEAINELYPIYPLNNDRVIKDFTYGVIVGGGIEFPFSEFIGGLIEFSVNPDFSLQYEQPAGEVFVNNQLYTGNLRIPERKIRNLTFEVTLGFRFLHKIEYID